MRIVVALLIALAACSDGEYRAARGVYNDGVAALAEEDWARAEELFLRARSEAGVDPELRWRAAYNLGLAYTGHAESVRTAEPPDLEQALSLYATAAGWFQDAVRQRPADREARENLAIVRARQQAVADELAADEKLLEQKLERLIAAQRDARDGARALLDRARAGAAANPAALEDEARALATAERTLLADAGVVVDLAGAEIDRIAGLPEDQVEDEERVRRVQLEQLDLWMQLARTAIADTRRMLDAGTIEGAHGRAEEAVEALKRAREQLLDPVAVLREIAGDEVAIAEQTAYLDAARAEAKKLGGDRQELPVPAWLTEAHLGARQTDARSRLDELAARLGAAAQAELPADAPPAQARLVERVKTALPSIEEARGAMLRAQDALAASDLGEAREAELAALLALGRAIEQFVELRQAIDLAWEEQGRVVAGLEGGDAKDAAEVRAGIERNVGRMALIEGLIADEKEAAAGQGQGQGQGQGTEVFDEAERLRGEAAALIGQIGRSKRPAVDVAREAHDRLTELRRIFFSIEEHLADLIRAQGETRDDTAEAAGLDDVGRAPLLPGLTTREGEHRATAQAIADALAQRADAAAQAPEGAEAAKRDGAAAEEVRAAIGQIELALGELERAKAPDQPVSVDLSPALDAQKQALVHLEAALRILQPPPPEQQQQQDEQQQQDQPQQDQQQQDQPPQDQSVERRRERVREQEAQRRRERDQRQRMQHDPVEKDW